MKCPRCSKPMDSGERAGIRTSACPACGGSWISGGSLHELFAREEDAPHIEEALETILDLDFVEGRRQCPTCRGRRLKTLDIDDVELDYCIGCKGLFFDPGELERVFPTTHAATASADARSGDGVRGFFRAILARLTGDDD